MADKPAIPHWTTEQQAAIEWLALPSHLRNPKSQVELAAEIGVHPITITKWKRKPEFVKAFTELARNYLRGELPAVYGALTREAVEGDIAAIKLYLQLLGEITERSTITLEGSSDSPVALQVIPINYRHALTDLEAGPDEDS